MDENVPVHMNNVASRGQNVSGRPNAIEPRGKQKKHGFKFSIKIAGFVILVAAFSTIGWLFYQSSTGASIDGSKYQAISLVNGSTYFGKLKMLNGDYVKLTDIYYPELKNATSSDLQDSANSSAEIQLIKLGDEVHGPEDEMVINKSQIIYFENLKKDGKVTTAILKYKNQ